MYNKKSLIIAKLHKILYRLILVSSFSKKNKLRAFLDILKNFSKILIYDTKADLSIVTAVGSSAKDNFCYK